MQTRYRLAVASRVLAAAVGGYVLTSVLQILLALVLPLGKADALSAAMMLSFLVYALVIIWVFSVNSVARAWLGLLVSTLTVSGVVWLLLP